MLFMQTTHSLLFAFNDTTHLIGLANSVLDKLNTCTKTKAGIFRAQNGTLNISNSLHIGDSVIEIVSTAKSLGVIIEEHVT